MTERTVRQRGLSLIELMVAMIIALVTSIAIFQLMASFEAQRRRTSAGSDSQQQGAIAAYLLERVLRQAGAGMAQGARLWGCQLVARRDSTAVLPRSSAWPVPFEGLPQQLRAAPVLAFAGGAGAPDTLLVMHGTAPSPNVPVRFTSISPGDPRDVFLNSTVGINHGRQAGAPAASLDLGLVFNDVGAFGGPCEVQRIATVPAPGPGGVDQVSNPVRFGVANDFGRSDGLSGFAATSSLFNLGPQPALSLIGIKPRADGSGADLVMHDALERDGPEPLVAADNVVDLRVLYGVDDGSAGGVPGDHRVDAWVRPEGGTWSAAALGNGSPLAAERFHQIQALRVGLVLRSTYRERDAGAGGPAQVRTSSVTLFADTPTPYTRSFSPTAEEGRYRYDAVELTVPVRNLVYRKAGS